MCVCVCVCVCMYICMYVYKPARDKANSEACLLHVYMCVCVCAIYMYVCMYIYRLGVRLTARPASFMNSGSTATMSSMLLQTQQSAYVVEAKP